MCRGFGSSGESRQRRPLATPRAVRGRWLPCWFEQASGRINLLRMMTWNSWSKPAPYRVSLASVKDEVPQVAVRLSGISSAVTPDAVLPFVGKITDDYGLYRALYEYQVDGGDPLTLPIGTVRFGQPTLENLDRFDLRATDAQTGQRSLTLKPKQRFSIVVKSTDSCNLTDEAHAGSSQQFTLEVVTSADLLALRTAPRAGTSTAFRSDTREGHRYRRAEPRGIDDTPVGGAAASPPPQQLPTPARSRNAILNCRRSSGRRSAYAIASSVFASPAPCKTSSNLRTK